MSFIKKHAPFLAKPYIKIPLRIVGVILALVFILWIAIVAFVHYNKEFFVTIITGQINDNMSGSVSIKKIEPTLLQGFPDISFELKDVTVRDSLWDIHHRDLVKLESAYVSIGLWDALRKEAFIKKLTLTNGAITLYTDENEITNSKIFRKKDKKAKSTNNPLNDIELINVVLDIKHKVKKQRLRAQLSECKYSTYA